MKTRPLAGTHSKNQHSNKITYFKCCKADQFSQLEYFLHPAMETLTQGLSSGSEGVERFVETRKIHLVSNVWCTFTVAAARACAWPIIAVTTTIRCVAVAVRSKTTSTTTSTSAAATATTTNVSATTTRVVRKADVNTQQVFLLSMVCIIFLQYKICCTKTKGRILLEVTVITDIKTSRINIISFGLHSQLYISHILHECHFLYIYPQQSRPIIKDEDK